MPEVPNITTEILRDIRDDIHALREEARTDRDLNRHVMRSLESLRQDITTMLRIEIRAEFDRLEARLERFFAEARS